jgi:hypothetical protein
MGEESGRWPEREVEIGGTRLRLLLQQSSGRDGSGSAREAKRVIGRGRGGRRSGRTHSQFRLLRP